MRRLFLLTGLLALCMFSADLLMAGAGGDEQTKGDLELVFSPDLESVVRLSVASFSEAHPDIKVSLHQIEGVPLEGRISGETDLALVTKAYLGGFEPGEIRLSVIGREVYIPVMNSANPCLELIRESGIAPADFAAAYQPGKPLTWGEISGSDCNDNVHAYRINDPSFLAYLSDFTGTEPSAMGGTAKAECSMVMDAVRKDRLAMGFCTLNQLMQLDRDGGLEGILMIPVDMNENDHIDHFEQMYGSVELLERGIWIGKYPGTLYSRIYAMTMANRGNESVSVFLKWFITDGQEILVENGFSPLLEDEQATILTSLNTSENQLATPDTEKSGIGPLVIFAVLALLIVVGLVVVRLFNPRPVRETGSPGKEHLESLSAFSAPGGYYIDRSHTWMFLEKDGTVRIGVDHFLQHVTGKISGVGLKRPGEQVKKGAKLFTIIQHGKVLEIFSPVSGTITAINKRVEKGGDIVNEDPYGAGWICQVEPLEWSGTAASFIRGNNYMKWISEETARLKDFLATTLEKFTGDQVQPVLQDGGTLRKGFMEDFSPEAWEEFQTGFLHR